MNFPLDPRRILLALSIAGTLATAPAAQGTLGVANLNDYTINTFFPGTRSCQFLVTPAAPTTLTLDVDTMPVLPVVFLFNLGCPCQECYVPWTPTTCGLPPLGCGLSNQAFELWTPCTLIAVTVTATPGGNATLVVPVPTTMFFSTQAVVFDPVCDPLGLVFTQAYNVIVP